MPRRDITTPGAPNWIELFTSDPEASLSFYGRLFGWKADPANEEFGGYVNIRKDGQLVAGCMRNDGSSGHPDTWSVYLATDDAAALTEAATGHGGQVAIPPMTVGDLGTMAVVVDPGGAAVGAWQPGEHRGIEVAGEPGTPSWFELHTRAYDAAVAFYRDVFRWDAHAAGDVPDLRYTTLGQGDGMLAGIMDASAFLPADAPSHWEIYFAVADADATLAAVVELGGSVVQPAEDTPYGRLAAAADPTGARFKLQQP